MRDIQKARSTAADQIKQKQAQAELDNLSPEEKLNMRRSKYELEKQRREYFGQLPAGGNEQ